MTPPPIPRIIHQIWVGPNPAPTDWIDTWRAQPGWTHVLWISAGPTELLKFTGEIRGATGLRSVVGTSLLETTNPELTTALAFYEERGMWHGIADIVRVAVLHAFGGVYVDADTTRQGDLEDLIAERRLLLISGWGSSRVINGFLAGPPNHRLWRRWLEEIHDSAAAGVLDPPWNTIGGTMLTRLVDELDLRDHVAPTEAFMSTDLHGRHRAPEGATPIAEHYYATTHNRYPQ